MDETSGVESAQAAAESSKYAGFAEAIMDLPLESREEIVSYVPRQTLFSLQLVSKHFHHLASAILYRSLAFFLSYPESNLYYREPAYRLAHAVHTFITSDYDYAQHIKKFSLRMVETDVDSVQKRIAAKYHVQEEPGMLLNTAILAMLRKARAIEQFNWGVPIELSPQVYNTLSTIPSLSILHIHYDIASVPKLSTPQPYPPPPPGNFGNPLAPQWDPMTLPAPSSSSGSTKSNISTRSSLARPRLERRKFGKLANLRVLKITAIDSLSCLEQISLCLQASSKNLRVLSLSLAQVLVQKTRKSSSTGPGTNPNAITIGDDDMTEPNTPNTTGQTTGPNEADLKREKEAQAQVLARIFGTDSAPAEEKRIAKKLDKSLKATANARKLALTEAETDQLEQLATSLLNSVKCNSLSASERNKIKDLLKSVNEKLDREISGKNISGTGKKTNETPSSSKTAMPNDLGPISDTANGWSPNGFEDFFSAHSSSDKPPKAPYSITWSNGDVGSANAGNVSISLNPPPDWPEASDFVGAPPSMSHLAPLDGLSGMSSPPGLSYLPNPSSSSSSQPYPLPPIPPIPPSSLFNSVSFSSPSSEVPESIKKNIIQLIKTHHAKGDIEVLYKKLQDLEKKFTKLKEHELYVAHVQHPANLSHQNTNGMSKSKSKSPMQAVIDEDTESEDSSDMESDSESPSAMNAPSAPPLIDPEIADVLDIDVDMEHPDVVSDEELDNEEPESDEDNVQNGSETPLVSEVPMEDGQSHDMKDKGKAKVEYEAMSRSSSPLLKDNTPIVASTKTKDLPSYHIKSNKSPEETMQEYVRMTHGFRIEELSLYLVPLKPSVLAKALDLTCLRRLVLYSVGSQGAFWMMIDKYVEQGVTFNFQEIHSDDISTAFVNSVGKLSGLKALHMLRRSSKAFDCTTSKPPASNSDIQRGVLRKHLETLESLSIVNQEDNLWDLNERGARLLSVKGKKLREISFSLDMSTFHILMRCLPGMKSLRALHFVNIRSTNASIAAQLQSECKRFVLDVLYYCPTLKLKYVCFGGQAHSRVHQISEKPKLSMPAWLKKQEQELEARSGKGKGKATAEPLAPSGKSIQFHADGADDDLSDPDDPTRPHVSYSKAYSFNAMADSYSIFSNLVLNGKL